MNKLITFIAVGVLTAACGTQPKQEQLCGGWSVPQPLDSTAMTVFQAVPLNNDSVGYVPKSVTTQVVAGTNYCFRCDKVTFGKKGKTQQVDVTIFVPLPGQGEPTLTSIENVK